MGSEMCIRDSPSNASVSNFREILRKAGHTVTVRTTRADDIGAACGQLVGEVSDQTSRSIRHQRRMSKVNEKVKLTGKLAAAAEST